jgi:hypothetical protein
MSMRVLSVKLKRARVGLLDRYIDLSSLADYWHWVVEAGRKRISAATFAAKL